MITTMVLALALLGLPGLCFTMVEASER